LLTLVWRQLIWLPPPTKPGHDSAHSLLRQRCARGRDLKKYRIEVMTAGAKNNKDKEAATGLEQLDKTDLFIGTTQKRTMPSDKQLAHVRKYFEAGKPFVGFRQASHMFQNWLESDKYILGAKYGGHHLQGKETMLKLEIAKDRKHPIIKGIKLPHPGSGSYFYTELDKEVTLLISPAACPATCSHAWSAKREDEEPRLLHAPRRNGIGRRRVRIRDLPAGIAWARQGCREVSIK
jgi:hypothetical protein